MSENITLKNLDINGFLTDLCNGKHVTIKQLNFLRKALRINLKEQCSFCRDDFPELSAEYFRQHILKLKGFIKLVTKSKPCFYRIVGTPEMIGVPSVTDRPTGDVMLMMLRNAREQPASIHDIRIQTHSDNLYEILKKNGEKPHPQNKGILLPTFRYDVNVRAKAHVYPQTISIDIACTNRPLVYDVSGAVQLLVVLGQIYRDLQAFSKFEAKFPPVTEWKITMFHLGKDGTQSFCGQSFEMRVIESSIGTIRYYNKVGADGKRRLRVEIIARPDITLMQEIDRMINTEDKYRESYLDNHDLEQENIF